MNSKTYILPDFEKLSPLQQAKILMHEETMRESNATSDIGRIQILERALKEDSVIQKISAAKNKDSLDVLSVLQTLAAIGKLNYSELASNIFQMINEEMGREVSPYEIDSSIERLTSDTHTWTFNPSMVQDFQEKNHLSRNYAEMLEGIVFDVTSAPFTHGKKEFLDKMHIEFGNLKYTSAENTSFYISEYSVRVMTPGPFLSKFKVVKKD